MSNWREVRMKYSLAYIAAIVAANWGFTAIPPWFVFGAVLPPMTFLVGAVFVLRDFAQREVGHWVLVPMIIGVGLSFIMADPFVAMASAVAFAISEGVDWIVYTRTDRPLRDRILISSSISVPVDSAAFLLLAGFFSWIGFTVMVVAKMVAALIVWRAAK